MLVDLHAHVVPGVDDGPRSTAESLALLGAMSDEGITTVVASAHACDGRYNVTRGQMLRQTLLLQEACRRVGLNVQLFPSLEYTLGLDLVLAARQGQLLTIGESLSPLVELPGGEYPFFAERALRQLAEAGYRPVLNHPERCPAFQADPDRFWRLAERTGILAMVTAAALSGDQGRRAARLAREVVTWGREQVFLVTDAHDLLRRPPRLTPALALAKGLGKADQSAEWSLLRKEGPPCTTRESDCSSHSGC